MPRRTRPRFYTPADIADAYNTAAEERGDAPIDVRTVRRECKAGRLRAETVGRSWLIAEADAAAWLSTFERYGRKNGAAVTVTAAP